MDDVPRDGSLECVGKENQPHILGYEAQRGGGLVEVGQQPPRDDKKNAMGRDR